MTFHVGRLPLRLKHRQAACSAAPNPAHQNPPRRDGTAQCSCQHRQPATLPRAKHLLRPTWPPPTLQNIFHRDLRMDNLLLHGNYFESTLKISNFGYSKSSVLDSMAKTAAVGAPAYTPPELLLLAARSDGSAYDGAAIDVWASGIILYCLLTGKLPFLVGPHAATRMVPSSLCPA